VRFPRYKLHAVCGQVVSTLTTGAEGLEFKTHLERRIFQNSLYAPSRE